MIKDIMNLIFQYFIKISLFNSIYILNSHFSYKINFKIKISKNLELQYQFILFSILIKYLIY